MEAGVTHHIVLDDGTTQIGLMGYSGGKYTFTGWHCTPLMTTSIKTSTGEQQYSDLEPPYGTIAQDNWESGRGQELLEDKDRFYDSSNLWTMTEKQAILAPRQLFCDTGAHFNEFVPDVDDDMSLSEFGGESSIKKYSQEFTTDSTGFTANEVLIPFAVYSVNPSAVVTVSVCADDDGDPGSSLGSTTVSLNDILDYKQISWIKAEFSSGIALSASTKYHLVIEISNDNDEGDFIWLLKQFSSSQSDCLKYYSGAVWVDNDYYKGYFRFNEGLGYLGSTHTVLKFVEYKDCLYAMTNGSDQGISGRIFRNGDRGACDSNSGALGTLVDATKSWVTNEWAGCYAKIISGPGYSEVREIQSNTSNTLTVSPDWSTTHTTSSSYVILGSNKWTNVTPTSGDTIDLRITDAEVSGGYLCICQGSEHDILMWHEWNSSGVWTQVIEDNVESAKAELIVPQFANKQFRMYRVFSEDKNDNWQFSYSIKEYVDFADSAVPAALKLFRNRPTSLMTYGAIPYIFTDSKVFTYYKDALESLDIDYSSQRYGYNGINAASFNMFIYFPILYGLFRTSGSETAAIGPNLDAGLPSNRQGRIAYLCPTVDVLYYSINAGDGRSSIMAYNSFGHHEIARGITDGEEIEALFYQVIPGGPNKLWYGEGSTIRHVNLPRKTSNPFLDSSITYNPTGELITSWINVGMAEADKFFHEIKVVGENAGTLGNSFLSAYYQTDTDGDDDDWNFIGFFNLATGSSTLSITEDDSLSGRRIRFKFSFMSVQSDLTPRLTAWALNTVTRIPPKYSYAAPIIISDKFDTLGKKPDTTGAAAIITQLRAWADSSTPVTLTSVDSLANNISVFVEPTEYRPEKLESSPRGDDELVYLPILRLIEA